VQPEELPGSPNRRGLASSFAELTYAEWNAGTERLPALYWDPWEGLQTLMSRAWTPIRWG
jgi:hypothetical protein